MQPCRGVLIVDDDAAIRAAIVEALTDEGLPVEAAANGAEALAWLRSAATPPCLILLDIMMPVMDGWTFRAQQTGDPALAGIPVVVLTAGTNAAEKAAELNAAGGIPKPLRLDVLLSHVERFCRR